MDAKQNNTQVTIDTDMRILKIGTCPSLSSISEISFMVGCPINSQDIADMCLKIAGNTSSGKWNGDWIQISKIDRLLSEFSVDQSFTAAAFHPLYPNASSNSPGFMAGICLHLGLIARVPEGRAYVRDTGEMFFTDMGKALADGVDLVPSSIAHSAGNNAGDTAKVKPGKKSKSVTATSHPVS